MFGLQRTLSPILRLLAVQSQIRGFNQLLRVAFKSWLFFSLPKKSITLPPSCQVGEAFFLKRISAH